MFMFDNYEITLISEFDDGEHGTFCEPYTENDEKYPSFKQKIWSIYGHFPNDGSYKDPVTGDPMHGVDCLCDFKFEAEKHAFAVYNHFMNTLRLAKNNEITKHL